MEVQHRRRRTPRRIVTLIATAGMVAGLLAGLAPAQIAIAGTTQNFLIVYGGATVSSASVDAIRSTGGSVVTTYPQIGVVLASSSSTTFAADVERRDSKVIGVSATGAFATRLNDGAQGGSRSTAVPATPATDGDSLSGLQWDMIQIHTPEAHAINGGSPSVVVGDIDTGLDWTHPDLAPNVDFADSASCISGVADNSPAAWLDDNGHGTHTAGTIAAASNGIGIVGVAPNVKIAAIKAGNADGFFFPEAVVCAFVWAGTHHINVTNNSYFADPWLFNCKNDPGQRAIWTAERRAISFAMSNGTTVVAAEGNEADDLAHPTQDVTSPDNTTPVTRAVTNACAVVPVEVPGVIGVTANGNLQLKSFYSSYGMGTADVTAPGGDSILQVTPAAAPFGRVLSTWPAALASGCLRPVVDPSGAMYCYLQGTSMASPHVAGVAALVESTGITAPGAVAARISSTADPLACPPDLSIYSFFPSVSNGAPQQCTGGTAYNSFNGHGQVDALNVVR